MRPSLRRLALTAHVTFSVGWLGAVGAYLALAIGGLSSQDPQVARAAYLSMELLGRFVIVPCSLAALLTGLLQSLGTEWGLFRHYWILGNLLLSTGGTVVLLVHMKAVRHMAGVAAETTLSSGDFRALRLQLIVHAAGGLLVLLAATALSVLQGLGSDGVRAAQAAGGERVVPVTCASASVGPPVQAGGAELEHDDRPSGGSAVEGKQPSAAVRHRVRHSGFFPLPQLSLRFGARRRNLSKARRGQPFPKLKVASSTLVSRSEKIVEPA